MDSMKLNNEQQIPSQGFGVFLAENNGPCEESVSRALQAGYRLIDTAAAYFNETDVGKAIKKSGIFYRLFQFEPPLLEKLKSMRKNKNV